MTGLRSFKVSVNGVERSVGENATCADICALVGVPKGILTRTNICVVTSTGKTIGDYEFKGSELPVLADGLTFTARSEG